MKIFLIKVVDHDHIILNGFTDKKDAEKFVERMKSENINCFIEENEINNLEVCW